MLLAEDPAVIDEHEPFRRRAVRARQAEGDC
jgi:hypothetical protein